jgi:hypothetical protein
MCASHLGEDGAATDRSSDPANQPAAAVAADSGSVRRALLPLRERSQHYRTQSPQRPSRPPHHFGREHATETSSSSHAGGSSRWLELPPHGREHPGMQAAAAGW